MYTPIYGYICAHTCPIAAPMWPMYAPIYGPYMAHVCAHACPIAAPIYGLYMRVCIPYYYSHVAYIYADTSSIKWYKD